MLLCNSGPQGPTKARAPERLWESRMGTGKAPLEQEEEPAVTQGSLITWLRKRLNKQTKNKGSNHYSMWEGKNLDKGDQSSNL